MSGLSAIVLYGQHRELLRMSRYDVSVWLRKPETYTVDLLRADLITGSRPKKVFRNYADFIFAMIDLGLNRVAIASITADFALNGYATVRQIELPDEAIVRFRILPH